MRFYNEFDCIPIFFFQTLVDVNLFQLRSDLFGHDEDILK